MAVWSVFSKHRFDFYFLQNLLMCLLIVALTRAESDESLCTVVSNDGVFTQDCSNRDLTKLPTEISENAQSLDFSQNKITEISFISETFACSNRSLCKVNPPVCRTNVSFSGNWIKTIVDHAFHGLRCLQSLDLSFNKITGDILHSDSFQEGFFYLQKLKLNNNPLGSLPENVITQPFLPDLRELDLSHCDLEEILNNSVDDFGELRILNLSFNKLRIIDSEAFKGLKNLEYLDLRENQLTYFSEHIFGDLGNLKVLLLSGNKIEGFHERSFYSDSNLEVLDLRNNQLNKMPYTALDKLTKLQTLDLSRNPIQQVTSGASPSNVQTLILDNIIGLTELGPYALTSFPALVNLSISGNTGLAKIHSKFLGDNTSLLKHLRLENNKLSTLNLETLPWRQLASLTLRGNPWYCDNTLEWMINVPRVRNEVICSEPHRVKGQRIGNLNSEDLVRDISLQTAVGVIVLCLTMPIFGVCALLVWKRRRFCACFSDNVKGRYVALFQGDGDEEGNRTVDIQLKVNVGKLKAVSNGKADDTKPFIMLQESCYKIDEEPENYK